MCFGTAGLDPALEGFSDEGLNLLVSGTEASPPPPPAHFSPTPSVGEYTNGGGGQGFDVGGIAVESSGVGLGSATGEKAAEGMKVDGGDGMANGEIRNILGDFAGIAGVNGGDAMALGEFDADSVGGSPEVRGTVIDGRVGWVVWYGGLLNTWQYVTHGCQGVCPRDNSVYLA